MGHHHYHSDIGSSGQRHLNEQWEQGNARDIQDITARQQQEDDSLSSALVYWYLVGVVKMLKITMPPMFALILTLAALNGPWWSKLYYVGVNGLAAYLLLPMIRARAESASKLQWAKACVLALAGGVATALVLCFRAPRSTAKSLLYLAVLLGGIGGYEVMYSIVHASDPPATSARHTAHVAASSHGHTGKPVA